MKVIVEGFIIAKQDEWMEEPEFIFREYDSSKYSSDPQVMVKPHTIEFEIPDGFDIRPGLVESLEQEKQKLMAAVQSRITEINAKIQSLLAIEA
ncbi:hypothetical protein [Paraburkholderia sp. BL9I2N2]|uniref:hypothetical protein n=1 Tax=Paraburkholderia sp. BL9I2N2 TaxID=1938809 RepID=UPI00104B3215|nr:hypothetical protein [Paraburkholderia sp. BL9I2N2]TCK87327.1 hypothetical protein B0G74_7866 [Paraburkholderia sp. BL9I2N2]